MDVASVVVALASHGLSYTPDQVRDMTGDDMDALVDALAEAEDERERERGMAEARGRLAARRHR